MCVSLFYPDFAPQSQGLALKVSFDATAACASLETGCVTMTTTAGTTQTSGTAVSKEPHTKAPFLDIFSVVKQHTQVIMLDLFQSCWRVVQVPSSVSQVTVSPLLCSVMVGLIVRTCQMRPAVVSKLPDPCSVWLCLFCVYLEVWRLQKLWNYGVASLYCPLSNKNVKWFTVFPPPRQLLVTQEDAGALWTSSNVRTIFVWTSTGCVMAPMTVGTVLMNSSVYAVRNILFIVHCKLLSFIFSKS